MALTLCTFALTALLIVGTNAQRCNSRFSGPRTVRSNLQVTGVCFLEDITITGSVTIANGASLTTSGNVTVFGSLFALGSGRITLNGHLRVLGRALFSEMNAKVFVGPHANIGTVSLSNVRRFIARGAMNSINAAGGGLIELRGARILGGGVSRLGGEASSLIVCGATVRGGMTLRGVTGDLIAVAGRGCGASSLTGAVIVSGGVGDVHISGNLMLAADVIISEHVGDVIFSNAGMSDLALSRIKGALSLTGVTTDSDSSITLISGPVHVTDSIFSGDLIIGNSNAVTLSGNAFGNEFVTITANLGP
eukprot:IDg16218t1